MPGLIFRLEFIGVLLINRGEDPLIKISLENLAFRIIFMAK